jgi:hypothetical protein
MLGSVDMKNEDIGREVVVIISEHETVVGKITEVNEELGTFRLLTRINKEYQFSEQKVNLRFQGVTL